MVDWKKINLISEEETRFVGSPHVIFCRNVFIYFREDAIQKVVERFYTLLPSPGYLFVGVSESLFKLPTKFELTEIGKTFIYKKIYK